MAWHPRESECEVSKRNHDRECKKEDVGRAVLEDQDHQEIVHYVEANCGRYVIVSEDRMMAELFCS